MWSNQKNRMLSSLERSCGLEYEPEYEPYYDTDYRSSSDSENNPNKKKCFLLKYFGCNFFYT